MTARRLIAPLVATALAAPAAHAASLDLIAIGSLSGSFADLSSGTAGALENGVAGNLLGGLGSGLAWAGGSTFLATPDRGPNALSYNSALDNTTSYISRFQTLDLRLTRSSGGSALPYTLTPTLQATTLLSSNTPLVYGAGSSQGVGNGAPALNSAGHYYFSGRSDNYDPTKSSANPANGRFDPEAVRVSNDGKSVFISDEYGPYIYQFDRATGQRIRSYELPANLAANTLSPVGQTEIDNNKIGRVANKGMEGLAITPDGKTLVGIMQANLEQDDKKQLRIVTVDVATGATHEYGYRLTSGSGVSEIVAINDHEFLIDERDGAGLGDGSNAVAKQIFRIDLAGATDISGLSKLTKSTPAVGKTLVLDVVAQLNAAGISSDRIPAKLEGLSFGEDVVIDGQLKHTLFLANDNDFDAAAAGNNQFYVFALSDAQLGASFVPQAITNAVPEPETYAMLLAGLGVLGAIARRRQRR